MNNNFFKKTTTLALSFSVFSSPVIYAFERNYLVDEMSINESVTGIDKYSTSKNNDTNNKRPSLTGEKKGEESPWRDNTRRTKNDKDDNSIDFSKRGNGIVSANKTRKNLINQDLVVQDSEFEDLKISETNDLITITLNEEQVSNNIGLIEKTQHSPLVFANYDPSNAIGTIVKISSHRNSDGSAELSYKYISPRYFNKKSAEDPYAGLSEQQYRVMESQYGGNPAEEHIPDKSKLDDQRFDHAFYKVSEMGMLTFAGLVMKQENSTLGYYTRYQANVRTWKKKKKKVFTVKIYYHVAAELEPHWKVLLPIGSSTENDIIGGTTESTIQGGNQPFFVTEKPNGEKVLVNSGIQVLNTDERASSVDTSPFEIYHHRKSKTGLSNLTIILITGSLGAVSLGAGGAIGIALGGSISDNIVDVMRDGLANSISIVDGLTFDVLSNGFDSVKSSIDIDSYKSSYDFTTRWKLASKQKITNGPLVRNQVADSDTNTAIYTGNRGKLGNDNVVDFNIGEVNKWDDIIDPMFNKFDLNRNIQEKASVDLHKMFDNPYDNPRVSKWELYRRLGII